MCALMEQQHALLNLNRNILILILILMILILILYINIKFRFLLGGPITDSKLKLLLI